MADASDELERLSREQLILKARVLGAERAELLTRVELRDEIVRRSEPDLARQKRARGFLGVARDLVASVVEAGLNLPDAAAIIRGEGSREGDWKGPPPVATVTLAEIYAAQGHLDRALGMLDEVLAKEPDHDPARTLRNRLAAGPQSPAPAPRRRQRISFADPDSVLPREPEPAPPITEHIADPVPAVELAPEPQSSAAPPELEAAPLEAAPLEAALLEPEPEAAPEPEPEPEPEPAPLVPQPEPEPQPAPAPAAAAPAPPPFAPPTPSVVTLSLAGQRQIYWEVPPRTWDALRARAPEGRALLRVMSFRARAGVVERYAHDLSPNTEVGSAVLPGLRADAIVRAVLGWETEGRFLPFVLASDLASAASSPGRNGPFRAHPLVGATSPGIEQRALSHFARRTSP